MLPDQPALVLCPHCRAPIWLEELETVEEVWPGGSSSSARDAEPYGLPAAEDYFSWLERSWPKDRERYLRQRAWQAGNDTRRHGKSGPLSPAEERNLAAFAQLLPEADPGARLTKAEVFRELGRFEEVARLLEFRFGEQYLAGIAEQLRQLAARGKRNVVKLQSN